VLRDERDRPVLALDPQWRWALEARGTTLSMVGLDAPETRFTRGLDLAFWREEGWSAAAFTDDGTWVFALACRGGGAWLARLRADDGTLDPPAGFSSVDSFGCPAMGDPSPRLGPDVEGRGVWIAERARGVLAYHDGSMSISTPPHRGPGGGRGVPLDRGPALLGFDVRRETRAIASVGAGDGLRLGTFPGAALGAGDAIRVGLGSASGEGALVSPVAWAPTGAVLVHVTEDGRIALRDVARGRTVQTLTVASDGGAAPVPLAVLVATDGRSLAVSFDRGVALWDCAGL
jgi:hypothetical protein